MILSAREIRAALNRGFFTIDPDPRQTASLWSSTAIDLRLAGELSYWDTPHIGGVRTHVSPHDPDFNYADLVEQWGRPAPIPEDGFVIKPGKFYLGWSIEKIKLPHPSRVAARVEGKSSIARLGLGVHVTAPTIHAGFGYKENDLDFRGNPIQLEIWNVGPLPISVKRGMRICQLIFEEVHGTPETGYEGQFVEQGPGQGPS